MRRHRANILGWIQFWSSTWWSNFRFCRFFWSKFWSTLLLHAESENKKHSVMFVFRMANWHWYAIQKEKIKLFAYVGIAIARFLNASRSRKRLGSILMAFPFLEYYFIKIFFWRKWRWNVKKWDWKCCVRCVLRAGICQLFTIFLWIIKRHISQRA